MAVFHLTQPDTARPSVVNVGASNQKQPRDGKSVVIQADTVEHTTPCPRIQPTNHGPSSKVLEKSITQAIVRATITPAAKLIVPPTNVTAMDALEQPCLAGAIKTDGQEPHMRVSSDASTRNKLKGKYELKFLK